MTIPIFPLKLVVYPGELLNLHIFEPRYKQLINECNEQDIKFGIPTYIENQKLEYGTLMELKTIHRTYPDGRMDIRTKGLSVFSIDSFFKEMPGKLYPGAEVTMIKNDHNGEFILYEKIKNHLGSLYNHMNIKKDIPEDLEELKTFHLAHHVGLSFDEEYEFLKIPSELKRQRYLIEHMEKMIPLVIQMEEMRKRAQMNGHFKNIIPPSLD